MMSPSPKQIPWIGHGFLRLLMDEEQYQSLVLAFDEAYADVLLQKGKNAALLWFWSHLFLSLPPLIIRTIKWRTIMFANYLKIALRNIKKQKGYSFINVAGLAAGMACSILILAFIVDELSFDRFHEKAESIFRVATIGQIAGRTVEVTTVPAPMGPALVADFPEVKNSVRFSSPGSILMSFQDKKFFEDDVLYADASIFDVFSFNLLQGDPQEALKAPNTLVITRECAAKYFGEENPVGQTLRIANSIDYIITGIVEAPPANSHIQFEILASFETIIQQNSNAMVWYNWNYQTYIELNEGVDYREIDRKLVAFNEKYVGGFMKTIGGEVSNFLQPLPSIYLHSHLEGEIGPQGDIRYIYTFAAIGLFILLIACINFMNLSTAKAANRAKEVGLRKVVGAEKSMLVNQFLGESMLMAVFSLFFALVGVGLALPFFNNLAGRQISLAFLGHSSILLGMIVIVLFVGFIAGGYPAFFLSAFRPSAVLRGGLKKGAKNARFRQILVVFQFMISIALIIGTGTVLRQISFMQNMKLGYNKEQKVVLKIRSNQLRSKTDLLRQELSRVEGVKRVSASGMVPGEESNMGMTTFFPEGFGSDQAVLMETFYVDEAFIPLMDIELVAGRNFAREIATDEESAILINEAAARKLQWTHPVGKTIYQVGNNPDLSDRVAMTVIGVIKDIHHRSVHNKVEPSLITYRKNDAHRLMLQLDTNSIRSTMKSVEAVWNRVAPDFPINYFFLDAYFDTLFRSEQRLSSIFKTFTVLAVFIGCLGLFGLASFAAEQRKKEIGIRKALGASSGSILLILCKEFVLLVLMANILAWPAAFFLMRKWLAAFPYQAGQNAALFLLAGGVALFIALFTVSFQSVRAALSNPVESLRYE